MVEKARQKVIDGTRELIYYVVPIVQRAKTEKQKELAAALFEKFITEPYLTPETVKLFYDKVFPPPKNQLELATDIIKKSELLNPMIEQIETSLIISFNKEAKMLKKAMEALKGTIGKKLRQLTKFMG